MGNVTEESPRDIWNGDKFNEVRMMITEGKAPNLCKKCGFLFAAK